MFRLGILHQKFVERQQEALKEEGRCEGIKEGIEIATKHYKT